MDLQELPMCCGVHLISRFGQTEDTYEIYGSWGNKDKQSEEDIYRKLEEYEDLYWDDTAFFMATTNNEQTRANRALRKRGYKRTKWVEGNDGNKVAIWYKSAEDNVIEED